MQKPRIQGQHISLHDKHRPRRCSGRFETQKLEPTGRCGQEWRCTQQGRPSRNGPEYCLPAGGEEHAEICDLQIALVRQGGCVPSI